MFWSKARKIEKLKTFGAVVQSQFETAQTKAVQRLEEIRSLKKEIVGLTAEVHKCQTVIIPALVSDRDQFAKRVEELEEQVKNLRSRIETTETNRDLAERRANEVEEFKVLEGHLPGPPKARNIQPLDGILETGD